MTRARNIAGFSTITTTPSPVHVGPIGVLTATRIDGEFNQVDLATRNITAAGIAATNLQVSGITTGLNVSGIITAQNGINFNGTSTGLNVSGIGTIATLNVSGNATIAGVLTYEDVTNVDSVGVVTARGLNIIGNTTGLNAGISTFTGDVSIADKIVHTGDTDTFMSFPSADTIRFETGGAARLILSSGNILQQSGTFIVKNATSDSNGIKISQESSDESRIFNHFSGPLTFGTANSERMRITSGGQVGIASATPRSGFTLDVAGDLSVGTPNGVANSFIDQKQDGDLHLINSGRTSNGVSGNLTGGAGGVAINKFNTRAGGTSLFRDFCVYDGKSTKVLMVDGSSGEVGIGTDDPTGAFEINWNGSSTDMLMLSRPGTGGNFARLGHNTAGGTNMLDVRSEGHIRCLTNGNNERLRITSGGQILIGTTTTPVSNKCSLRVAYLGNTSSGNAIEITQQTNGADKAGAALGLAINNGGASTNASDLLFSTANGGSLSERMRILYDGNLVVNGTSDTAPDGFDSLIQVNAANHQGSITIGRHTANANGPALLFQKSRSGSATPGTGVVSSGDVLGTIRYYASDGTDRSSFAANIGCEVDGTPGGNDMPGRLIFGTTKDGAASSTERLRISQNGVITSTYPTLTTVQDTNLTDTSGDRFQITLPDNSRMINIKGSFSFDSTGTYQIWADYGDWSDSHSASLEGVTQTILDGASETTTDSMSGRYFSVATPVDCQCLEVTYDITITTMPFFHGGSDNQGGARPGIQGTVRFTSSGTGNALSTFSIQDTNAKATDRLLTFTWDIDGVSGTLGTGKHHYVMTAYPLTGDAQNLGDAA